MLLEHEEWSALSNKTTKMMTKDPVRTKLQENKKIRTTRFDSDEKYNENQIIFLIITRVQNTSLQESESAGVVIRFPTNVSRTQLSDANRRSASVIRKNQE